MRIGIFTDSYIPQANGVATSTYMLVLGLREMGHEAYVITTNHRNNHEEFPYIIRLDGFNVPLKAFDGFQFVLRCGKHFNLIKEMNFDIIHIHTEFSIGHFGLYCARKLKIPYLYTMHTMYEEYMHHVIKHGQKLLRKPYLAFVKDRITAFSSGGAVILPHIKVKEMFDRYGIKTYQEVIPTGLDLTKFSRSTYKEEDINALKEKLNIKDKKVLLYIGRLALEKSLDLIIEQFAKRNDDLVLLIVGCGPVEEDLKKQAKRLNISHKVIFAGYVPWVNIGIYYQLGDCFINASKSETQGLTYTEALSAGLPVVVRYDTNLDGLITDGENGLFYNEMSEFNSKIDYLFKNDEVLSKIKNNAVSSVAKYSKEIYAQNCYKLYEKVLGEK